MICYEGKRSGTCPARKENIVVLISSTLTVSLFVLLGTTRRCHLGFAVTDRSRFDVTGYGKRNVPLGHGMRFSVCEQTRSIRPIVYSRREGIEICSRVADDADDPFPPKVTRVTKLVPIETGSELVSRFKGVIVSYCKVSIDSSQLRCTVFSKYLG